MNKDLKIVLQDVTNVVQQFRCWANTKDNRQRIEREILSVLGKAYYDKRLTDYDAWCDGTNNDYMTGCGAQIWYVDVVVHKRTEWIHATIRMYRSQMTVFFSADSMSDGSNPTPQPVDPNDAWNRSMRGM